MRSRACAQFAARPSHGPTNYCGIFGEPSAYFGIKFGIITDFRFNSVFSRIHAGIRPYKCTYCDRAFTQSNDLTLHIRRHTGEKPYACGICGERFIQGSALAQHRRQQNHFEDIDPNATPVFGNSVNNPYRNSGANPTHRVEMVKPDEVRATARKLITETDVKPVISINISTNGAIMTESSMTGASMPALSPHTLASGVVTHPHAPAAAALMPNADGQYTLPLFNLPYNPQFQYK